MPAAAEFRDSVWGVNHGSRLDLTGLEAEGDEIPASLQLTIDPGGAEETMTILLEDWGVRQLRLALTRYERARTKES